MHRHARDFRAPGQRIAHRMRAWKRGQERGMHVEDSAGKMADEGGRENPHEAGQADQLHAGGVQLRDQSPFKRRAALEGVWLDDIRRDAGTTGAPQRRGLRIVGEDHGDARPEPSGSARVQDRLQIRAAA